MGNYIKTLILSTIVLVIGNSRNYCYSMVVHHIDRYGISRTVDNKAIPDKDANGNVIENEHFLKDSHYVRDEFLNKYNNLNNLVQNLINGQNITEQQKSILRFITDRNFFYRDRRISHVFEESWGYLNRKDHERLFNVNIVNNRIPGIISQNTLEQYLTSNNIPFDELLNYISNKLRFIMINSMERIINIINLWNGQRIDELINEIVFVVARDYYGMENTIQSFFNFCNNNNYLDQTYQLYKNRLQEKINTDANSMENKSLKILKKRSNVFCFYESVEKIQENDLINFDLVDECMTAIQELHHMLSNIQGFQEEADIIRRFGTNFNGLVGQIGDRNFVNNLFDEYKEQINMENIDDDVLQNAVTLSGQLANSIAIHVKNMLINIKNGMVNNNLNNQQLRTLIMDNVSHCIHEVQNASHNVKLQLEDDNNVLHQLDIQELLDKNKFTNKAVDSINKNNEHLNELKQQYGL